MAAPLRHDQRICVIYLKTENVYIYSSSVSILSLIDQRSYAVIGMPGCQLATAALQQVRPLFTVL